MRLKFQGRYDPEQIKEHFAKVIDQLVKDDVHYFRGINVYLTPENEEKDEITFYSEDGETELQGWVCKNPSPVKKVRKKKKPDLKIVES